MEFRFVATTGRLAHKARHFAHRAGLVSPFALQSRVRIAEHKMTLQQVPPLSVGHMVIALH